MSTIPTDLLLAVLQDWAERQGFSISQFPPDWGLDDIHITGSRGVLMLYYSAEDWEPEDTYHLMYSLCVVPGAITEGRLEPSDPEFFNQLQALLDQIS
jgi:hypothetical protein